jgi:hypothetical protein
MTKKNVVVVVGAGREPQLLDISTPLPPVKAVPGSMPRIEKPFLELLDELNHSTADFSESHLNDDPTTEGE